MHYIERRLDGIYEVGVYGQGGYERTEHDTEAEAVASYRRGVAWLDPRGDPAAIVAPPVRDRTRWPVLTGGPDNRLTGPGGCCNQAVRLALGESPVRPGVRYEMRVVLVEVEGPADFIGEGI